MECPIAERSQGYNVVWIRLCGGYMYLVQLLLFLTALFSFYVFVCFYVFVSLPMVRCVESALFLFLLVLMATHCFPPKTNLQFSFDAVGSMDPDEVCLMESLH